MKLILYITALLCFYSSATSMTIDTIIADEIVISASRIPKVYSETIRRIEIINRSELESMTISGIDDILESQSAIDIRSRGTFGIQSDINIRGGNHNQALILLNGFPMNDPQTGHHNINLPISQYDISKIEILEGSGSRVLGPNAYSGAMNFISKPNGNDLIANISFGEYDLFEGYLRKDFSFDDFSALVSVSKQSSKGYTENTDFDILNLFTTGTYKAEFGEFDYILGYNNKKFGAENFYTTIDSDQYEHIRSFISGIGFKTGTEIIYEIKAFWKRHQDRFELFRDDPAEWYGDHNYHLSNVLSLSNNFSYSSSYGISNLGIDLKNEHIYSNVLGELMKETVEVPFENNALFTKETNRFSYSIFGEHNVKIDYFSISAGLMVFNNNVFGTEVYPGIDLSHDISDEIKIGASFNKNLRLPTFTELYYDGPTNIGNPDLKPETSIEFELGAKYNTQANSFSLSIFRSEGDNIIDWVKLPAEEEWTTDNITELVKNGISVSYSYNNKLQLLNGVDISSTNLSYTYIDIEKSSSDYISYYLLDYLRHKFTAGMKFEFIERFILSFNGNYQYRNGTYTDLENVEKSYDPVFLINTKLMYAFDKIQIALNCQNLTDERYRDISSVVMPGRWLKFEIGYKIGFD